MVAKVVVAVAVVAELGGASAHHHYHHHRDQPYLTFNTLEFAMCEVDVNRL